MMSCDDIREAVFLGDELDAEGRAHLESCAACRRETEALRRAANALARESLPEPSAVLTRRVLEAARPLLAQHARTAGRAAASRLPWAIAAAVVLLPVVLIFDAYVLTGIHALLSSFMPTPLSTYIVFNLGAFVLLLVTLTYGAVPLLADHQARIRSVG